MSVARKELVEASILSARTAGEGGRGRVRAKDREVRGVRGSRAVEDVGWASESELLCGLVLSRSKRVLVGLVDLRGVGVFSTSSCLPARSLGPLALVAACNQRGACFTLHRREHGLSAVVRLEPGVLGVLRGVGAEVLLEGNFEVGLEEVVIARQRHAGQLSAGIEIRRYVLFHAHIFS